MSGDGETDNTMEIIYCTDKRLETEAFSDCCDHFEQDVNTSLSPLSDSLAMTRADGGTDSSDDAIHLSLTFEDQLKQSHEETIVPFVSDHFKIPSSPPVEAIEYLQSGSYFKPATIFREHNAVCQLTFPGKRIFSLL